MPDFRIASANRLADEVITAAKAHGRVPDLLSALRDAGDDDALGQVVAHYLVETEDPALAQRRHDYAVHARRIARRPPVEELLGYLLDIPDFDLERVFIPLNARLPAPPAPSTGGSDEPRPLPPPAPAVAVTDLWPAREPWLLLVGEPGSGKRSVRPRRSHPIALLRREIRLYEQACAEQDVTRVEDFFFDLSR